MVWHVGTYSNAAVDGTDAETLRQFLQDGGRLFLEGENIAYEHGSDSFMTNVAHASYLENAAAGSLTPATKHPILAGIDGLYFNTTPPSPDGVKPENNGTGLAQYAGSSSYGLVAYDGLYWSSGGRAVYASFAVHYLYSSNRSALLPNILKWLTTSYYVKASTDKARYQPGWNVTITAAPFNLTTPLTGITVTATIYYPNGTTAAQLTLRDDGTGADETDDGNYTGTYTLPANAPLGSYKVEVDADIPGLSLIHI